MARTAAQIVTDIRAFQPTGGNWRTLDDLLSELWATGEVSGHVPDLLGCWSGFQRTTVLASCGRSVAQHRRVAGGRTTLVGLLREVAAATATQSVPASATQGSKARRTIGFSRRPSAFL